jgi:hypothetical protein
MFNGYIYCATSPSNKKYFGLTTTSLEKRKNGHLISVYKNSSHLLFHNAIRKYKNNFMWEIIEEHKLNSYDELLNILKEREIYFIKENKTYLKKYGYNSTYGGELGPNKETCKKISKINKEIWKNPEYRNKQYNTAHNPEFKTKFKEAMENASNKISIKIKEKWKDEEYRNKLIEIRNTPEFKIKYLNTLHKKEKIKCKYCNVESINQGIITRWHNENCKHKLNF